MLKTVSAYFNEGEIQDLLAQRQSENIVINNRFYYPADIYAIKHFCLLKTTLAINIEMHWNKKIYTLPTQTVHTNDFTLPPCFTLGLWMVTCIILK